MKEVKEKLEKMEEASDKLEPVCLVLKPEVHKPLSDLMKQLDKHMKSLELIQVGLQDIDVGTKVQDDKSQQGKNLNTILHGRNKQENVRDASNQEDDTDNPYAEIDPLKRQILTKKSSPLRASATNLPEPQNYVYPRSISKSMLNLPKQAEAANAAMMTARGYQRVEDRIPSPFANKHSVSFSYLC